MCKNFDELTGLGGYFEASDFGRFFLLLFCFLTVAIGSDFSHIIYV